MSNWLSNHSEQSSFGIYQNGSKDDRYYIAEDAHEQNLNYSELYHYGVKGMKWGVRKDLAKAKLSKSFNEARYSKSIQTAVNTKVGKAAKKALYTTFDVKNFDDLTVKVGKMIGSPKGIAALAAIVVLPDPLIWTGMAAYASVKTSGVLNRRLKHEDISMNELKHYGILGMKWGVRRTPEQLGHYLKTGSKVYRTTANPNEEEKGSTYVSFADPDRDFYKGTFANGIREYYKLNPDDPLYESVYSLKRDLKIPTEKHVADIVEKVAKENDSEKLREIAKIRSKQSMEEYKAFKKEMKESGWSDKDIDEEYFNYHAQKGMLSVDGAMKIFGGLSTEYLYIDLSRAFGREKIIKERVIQELRSEGYNAMLDQAGAGGKKGSSIEGYAPLIIFDRDETLSKISNASISKQEELNAKNRRSTWNIKDRSSWNRF